MKKRMYIAMLLAFICVVAFAAQVPKEKTQQQNAKFLSVDITNREFKFRKWHLLIPIGFELNDYSYT